MGPPVKACFIPHDLCRRAGIAASWLPINQMGIFPTQHMRVNTVDQPSAFAPASASVFQIRQEVVLFEPILRELVNEANDTFLSVQNLMASNNADFKVELLRLSRQYRSIIRACLENLQDVAKKAQFAHKEQLESYITIFYSVECIWHLCEILFVDNIAGNVVLPHLLDWIRFHFPKFERKAATFLIGDLNCLDTRPDYWEVIIGSLMQGRMEVVRALLRQHSAYNSSPFKLAEQSLKAMPTYNVYSGLSVTEFNLRLKHWLLDTQSKIDSKSFIMDENLDLVMRLAVGEENAWSDAKNHCETWYELLAAWLFFNEPTIKSYEFGQYARRCIARMGGREQMKHLDNVLLAAMEYDIFQVIKEIQLLSENGWFVTHLTDLLFHSGRLSALDKDESDEVMSNKLRESFLVDYGTLLMGHHSLWQVGLSYLDHCPNDGTGTIELLLSRIPLGSELRVQKIIREAQRRELPHIVQSICKVQGVVSLKRKRLGNALTWALKSQDGIFTSYLADKYLSEYSRTKIMYNTDLLDNLGSCMLVSDRLIFLGKYREFHKVYKAKDYKEASKIIISLMSSKLTPIYFWTTLFCDAVPLLENDDAVISSNDTFALLHCLQEKSDLPELKDKIELIQLAVSRNLAKALMYEAQIA